MNLRALSTILAAAWLATAAPARAELVTERWGQAGRCRHKGAVRIEAAGEGAAVTFDLSALPKGAAVYRARLLMDVKCGPAPLDKPIVIQPVTAAGAVEEKPLPLLGPRFRSFDATDVVRRWAAGKLANRGLRVRNAGGWDRASTQLEITYAGKLTDPPPPATDLRAFHRAGQVFLTFREVLCPFIDPNPDALAGKKPAEDVSWDRFRQYRSNLRAGKAPEVAYRIYRHTAPVTAANLHQAELLDEVPQLSVLDERMIKTEWKGERIKNVRVGGARVPRVCVEPLKELPVGTGVYVRTSDKPGKFHYAVIAARDGVENSRLIDAGNSLAQPLVERVASPEPILHHEEVHVYDKPRPHRFYLLWTDPPLSRVPNYYHVGVTSPPKLPAEGRSPLYVSAWWWDNGWARSGARRPFPGCVSIHMETPWVLHKAVHEGCGTYKAWSQGTVQDYWVRRLRNVLPWLERAYRIDRDRAYSMSSDWAWHHADLFAAVHENLTTDPKRSPTAIGSARFWGPVDKPADTEWHLSAWKHYDIAWCARKHVRREMPLVYYTPNMHLGDFGKIDKPRFYRAMLDTKRPFLAVWGMNVAAKWIYEIRRSDTLAAFGNCSLDSNPGIGMDDGDREGQINGYLRFDAATATDEPDRWEMTVWLYGGDKRGHYAAPAETCTVDVTPRRCRKFRPPPGTKLTWTHTPLPEKPAKPGEAAKPARAVQSGHAVADEHGLVTVTGLTVSKAPGRVSIVRPGK